MIYGLPAPGRPGHDLTEARDHGLERLASTTATWL
jgi:hypothetical protein